MKRTEIPAAALLTSDVVTIAGQTFTVVSNYPSIVLQDAAMERYALTGGTPTDLLTVDAEIHAANLERGARAMSA